MAAATVAASLPTLGASADDAKMPAGGESLFADVNGIRMHYVRAGSGPLVVLVHGWPQTWFAWHGIIPRFASRYTVIAVDLRGCGQSQRTEGGYDKRTIAEDLRALISHAGFREAYVVGHDMGGKASYFLAHLYPDAAAKLVLVDCLLPGTENLDALHGGAWHYGFHMAKDFPEMLTNGREREYIAAQIKAWSYKKDAISNVSIDEFARHYATTGVMTAGFNYYRGLKEDALFAETFRARKLKMPVLAIAGKFGVGDKLADALSKESDQLTRVIALDSGHFVVEESPEFFVKEVSQFLAA
jgi:pimeloyl-ACP methyl ester carboxylesterase